VSAPLRTAEELRQHYDIEKELADRLREAPTTEERRRLYSVVYRERAARIPGHPLVTRARDEAATRAAAAPHARLILTFVSPGSVVCEVGAGDGAVSRAVAPHVARAIAMDVTDALALPDDPGIGYEFRSFDGFDLGMPEAFDFVYSNDVAEHLHPDDFRDHAKAILSAIAPGGRYVCVSPNRLFGPHDISAHFTDEPTGFHLREYTATELAASLRAAGFRRTQIVLSAGGRRIGPLLPLWPITILEAAIERLPRRRRLRPARLLAAAKVVATR
jgi:2-polyprenyl-3-methyl-5-hydroxy-6-metoxy-1,4-benzoquinol methylase